MTINPYKLKPLKNLVVVKLPVMDETTEGGIYLAEKNKEPASIGTVISVGKDVADVTKNDVVSFAKYCPGPEFDYEERTFKLIDVKDITSVLFPVK